MAISIDRVMNRLDQYFAHNDYAAAERHLNYWYAEAQTEKDLRALFFITNEMIGFYRKQGVREKSLGFCDEALQLCETMHIADTVGAATAYINAATAYKAFEMPQRSMPLFEKAKRIYESQLAPDDGRLAGLYNNMGLALCDLSRFSEANKLYRDAVEILKTHADGAPDTAITYLNMANAAENEKGMDAAETEINTLLEKAQQLLDSLKDSENGYYAFVCEKCAPTFGYYGYFLYEKELKERAKAIYERN